MYAPLEDALVVQVDCTARRVRVSVRGELDLSNAHELRNAAFAAVDLAQRTNRVLELDLAGVSFCDSAGMRTLVEVHDEAQQKRVAAQWIALHDSVRYVAAILGLGALFEPAMA